MEDIVRDFYNLFIFYPKSSMGIINREGALFMATGFDTTSLCAGTVTLN